MSDATYNAKAPVPRRLADKGKQVERFTVALNSKTIQHLTLGGDFRATAGPADARPLIPAASPIVLLPPVRRAIDHASWQHARYFRGPSLSCAEWAMALVGRTVARAPDDQRRREALRQDAHVLAALVREGEILKRDAIDRILNAGVAFGVADTAIYEILNSEFMA
jgi:hypothetical protein